MKEFLQMMKVSIILTLKGKLSAVNRLWWNYTYGFYSNPRNITSLVDLEIACDSLKQRFSK